MEYIGKVYRPPSEWRSLIVQATVGCSNNTCTFCSMYKDDYFYVKDEEKLFKEFEEESKNFNGYRRAFIGDGDGLCLSKERIIRLNKKIKELFPYIERIGIYSTAKDVNKKSLEELKEIKESGIEIVYMGVETGSDLLLKKIKKNENRESFIKAAKKLHAANIKQSLTLITGLGENKNILEYAKDTGDLISEMNPEYLSFLALTLEPGSELYEKYMQGKFYLQNPKESLEEIYYFLSFYKGKGPTIFRSNHASNYLSLKGQIPEDVEKLKKQIENAIMNNNYRPEYLRGL